MAIQLSRTGASPYVDPYAPTSYNRAAVRLGPGGMTPLYARPEGLEEQAGYSPDLHTGLYTQAGGQAAGGGSAGGAGGQDELSRIYGDIGKVARRKARAPYSALRQQMEKSFARRGIDRSGFAGSSLMGVHAAEQEGLADVDANLLNQLLAMRGEIEQTDLMQKASKPTSTKKSWLGSALGVGAGLLGGILG